MPSRKKAQGRERKANSKPVEAPLHHPKASKSCSHGAPSNVPPVCCNFIDNFFKNFKKEWALSIEELFEVVKESLKHQQVAQDASLMGIVRSVYVSNGVHRALENDFPNAEILSMAALFLDMLSNFSSTSTKMNADLKARDLALVDGNDRAVVKWLSKNAPCSCLKQTLRDLRKVKDKTRKCYGCNKLFEISKLMACSGCTRAECCSEDCQKAHWRSTRKCWAEYCSEDCRKANCRIGHKNRKVKDKARKCWGCKELIEISKLMACDGCMMAECCSEDCQKVDWRIEHKHRCAELSREKKLLDQHRGL